MNFKEQEKIILMSPVITMKKGGHQDLLKHFIKEGFLKAFINHEIVNLNDKIVLNKNKKHNVDIIIDRLIISKKIKTRLTESIALALKIGGGLIKIMDSNKQFHLYNEHLACSSCNISFQDLEPRFFSFNSPLGACDSCDGLGTMMSIDEERINISWNALVHFEDKVEDTPGAGKYTYRLKFEE